MSFALRTLWYERRRFLPAVFAIAFSGMLMALQVGLLFGLIGVVAVPIENSAADVWVMHTQTPACDLARPIPRYWIERVWSQPEVVTADDYAQGFTYWKTPSGHTELILVVGCNLEPGSLGPVARLTADHRVALSEPGTVLLDRRDRKRLQIDAVGEEGEVSSTRVRVIGFVEGMGSISGPYVITSLASARRLLRLREDQTTYLLAKCKSRDDAIRLVNRLQNYPKMTAHLADDFAQKSKVFWIRKTRAGIALGFAAVLGVGVGATVTSQTLYAAIIASLRELAVLQALGIPRLRLVQFVLNESMLVGILGLIIAAPLTFGFAALAATQGAKVILPAWLLAGASGITLLVALLSGIYALRSLSQVEPTNLLR